MGRRLEYEVKTSVRLNMSNPQHVKINDVIQNLDPKIFKSKNQFIIDAIQFYIDNYGKETFVIKKKEKERAEYIRSEVNNLYLGNYYVKEITPSEGYLLDEEEHDVVCDYEGDLVAEAEANQLYDRLEMQYLEKHKPQNPSSTMEMWKIREQAKMQAEEVVLNQIVMRFH